MANADASEDAQGDVYRPIDPRDEGGWEPRGCLLAQLQDEFLALTRDGDPVGELFEQRRAEAARERGERA